MIPEQVILAYLRFVSPRPPTYPPIRKPHHKYLDFLNVLPMLYCYLLLAAIQGRHCIFLLPSTPLCTLPRQHLRNLQLICISGTGKGCSLSEIKSRFGPPPPIFTNASHLKPECRGPLHIYLFLCNATISFFFFFLLTYDFFLIRLPILHVHVFDEC